jgi:hypothetical protein
MTDTTEYVTEQETKTVALVAADGTVDNVIVIDPDAAYTPPEDCTLVDIPDDASVSPGAPAPEPEPAAPSTQEQLDALTAKLVTKKLITAADADQTKAPK